MSVIIRLQNLPLQASAMDIRVFFHGLSIPDGGVHIVGGSDGDAFIAFSSDEDARQAMNLNGERLKECTIKLLLSSHNEMFKVIEQARIAASGDDRSPSRSSGGMPSPQNSTIGSSLIESTGGMNASVSHNDNSSNLNPANNNTHPNMAMPGFPSGLNLLPNPMMSFQNMKLTPQQMNSIIAGSGMPGLFPQVPAPSNPFINMGFPAAAAGGPNQLNPLTFPGILPGILPQSMMPGIMNQQPPQMPSNNNPHQPMGSFPSPFNQTVNGMRMNGPNQLGNHAQQNSTFNHNMMSTEGQLNHHNGSGRQNFNNQGTDNFNRNRFSQQNETPKSGGLPFRPNVVPVVEPGRDRGIIQSRERMTDPNQSGNRMLDQNRDRDRGRDRETIGDRPSSVGSRRRSSEGVDKREVKRRRSRSRSRDRSRREGRRSRSRSRSRSRNQSDRPSSGRRSSNRSDSRDTPLLDVDSRNVSAHDLIMDETPAPQTDAACIMLSNVSNDASYRDVREFLRAEVRRYGIMRDYEQGTACIRLDNPLELEKVLRHDGRKLHGEAVRIEVVSLEVFEREARKHGAPIEYDRNKDRSQRNFGDRERPREFPERDRDCAFRGSRERERESRDQGECCLIVKGLPVNFNGADVANITLDGVIKSNYSDIHIHEEQADHHGRQFATAFVKFYSVMEAERAVEIISKNHGNHLRSRVAGIEELQKIRESVVPPSAKPLFEDESCNVMLKGVPLNMTERDVFDFFSDVGLSPIRAKMLTDSQTGNRIPKAICEFNDVPQARRAVGKDGKFFGRSAITVHMLPRRDGTGPAVRGGRGGILGTRPSLGFPHQNPRFQPQTQVQSENPFVQALNASVGIPIPSNDPPMRGLMRGGIRGRGGLSRGRGSIRPSRFAPADSTTNDINHNTTENPPSHFERQGCVLALTNIPFSANMDQIIVFLEETLGKEVPHDRIIRRYNEFQKPTGDARIAFDSHYETKEAFERLKGSRMWGRPLEVTILGDF